MGWIIFWSSITNLEHLCIHIFFSFHLKLAYYYTISCLMISIKSWNKLQKIIHVKIYGITRFFFLINFSSKQRGIKKEMLLQFFFQLIVCPFLDCLTVNQKKRGKITLSPLVTNFFVCIVGKIVLFLCWFFCGASRILCVRVFWLEVWLRNTMGSKTFWSFILNNGNSDK